MGLLNKMLHSDHAIRLLTADHREVDALFAQFEKTDRATTRTSLVTRICIALTVHAEIEEQLLYPAARSMLGKEDQDMIDEAFVEHASLKNLIQSLSGLRASSPLFKGYVTTLKEYVQHHVKEEEAQFFPKLEKTELDLVELGQRLATLKAKLMARYEVAPRKLGVVSIKLPRSPNLAARAAKRAPRAKTAA